MSVHALKHHLTSLSRVEHNGVHLIASDTIDKQIDLYFTDKAI